MQLSTNHPARVAERISTLDLVSHGRVELGIGELWEEYQARAIELAEADTSPARIPRAERRPIDAGR